MNELSADHVDDDHTVRTLLVDVVVPTHRRPELLDRCLRALAARHRLPNRVLVVARKDDDNAREVVKNHLTNLLGLEQVTVSAPGVLAAMAAGSPDRPETSSPSPTTMPFGQTGSKARPSSRIAVSRVPA